MRNMIIHSVNVQEGIGNATIKNKNVKIENGEISNISKGSVLDAKDYCEFEIIDGSDKTLMPGLIFAHTHIGYDNVSGPKDVLFKQPPIRLAFIASQYANNALKLGYTTMIGAGSICRLDVHMKEAIESGLYQGPKLMPASRDLMVAGPLGRRNKDKVAHIPSDFMPIICDSKEVREAVIKEIDDGAEIIKTFATGDDQFPNADSQEELFSLEELEETVKTAHERNTLVRCHARGKGGIENAISAGVDIIDHASYADDQCLQQILEKGISIVPSYYQPKRYLEQGHKYGRHPEESNFHLEVKNTARMLPIAESMGINIAVGDDFGFAWTPHGSYHKELIAYQEELNIPAATIIKWATSNGAKMVGLDREVGKIKVGYKADMILLNEDPAEDINALTRSIDSVFIDALKVRH